MRRLTTSLVTAAAIVAGGAQAGLAADMARPVYKAAPTAVMAPYNWTGFYVGGHAGWAWVKSTVTLVSDSTGSFPPGFNFCCDRDGFIGGGQVGFNWQSGHWVFGVEADWSWTNSDRAVPHNSPITPGVVRTATADDNWYATATGRIGYAQDNWLIYVKGGAAWFNHEDGAFATVPGAGLVTITSVSGTITGWTTGAGIEWALWNNWSAKIEYNYMDFGTHRHTFTAISPAAFAGSTGVEDIDTQVHAVKIGINYRFGDFGKGPVGKGPVVAKY